jgi:ubiquitin thioesterase protein OTUB1
MYDDPPATVELFCRRYVEPMAEESDNVHIVALTDALQV